MNIKDITSENYEQFKYVFWLDWSNKVKYIDLFKRGITSGETLGLFFIKDAKAVLELVNYYKDFKKIVIYDSDATISLLKDYDSINEFNDPRVEYIEIGQDLPMKFDKIIMNPPYSLGNKVTETILSSLNDNGDCICLMPLSQYKRKDLYKYVESFDLADSSFFEDAVITENLCICTLKKDIADKYSWQELQFASFDKHYRIFYKWNIDNNKSIYMKSVHGWLPTEFNINTDFIETTRCSSNASGAGFGKGGLGYAYNKEYKVVNDWKKHIGVIHFKSNKSKDNFTNYWYNGKKGESLASKVCLGIHLAEMSSTYNMWLPQIDWSNIHINQKELWDKGLYDEAVLSEMGLKWQGDSIVEC